MSASITPLFHHNIARTIYEDIQSRKSIYHTFVGQILPWTSELDPPAVETNISYTNDVRNNIISTKQTSLQDVSYVVNENVWTFNAIYDMYDDNISVINPSTSGATSLNTAKYYVLTDDYYVYKCIFNNNGVASTIQPTGTSIGYIETSDGYVWKFMAYVPLTLRNKFQGSGYFPITQSVKNQYYSNGTISAYTILDSGSGYLPEETYVSIDGDGDGADISLVFNSGQITDIIINDAGYGYTYANLIVTKGPSDAGSGVNIVLDLAFGNLDTQQSTVELSAVKGALSYAVVSNGGSGYTTASVAISGDGTGAVGTVEILNGVITNINLSSYGTGYSYANIVITGDGTGGTGRAIISPIGGHGSNAPSELLSDILCFYSSLENESNQGLLVDNQYRQYGLIKDVETYDSSSKLNVLLGSGCFLVTAPTVTNVLEDMVLVSGTKTFNVITSTSTQILLQSKDSSVPTVGNVLVNPSSEDVCTISDVIDPSINKFSGDMLIIDNRSAFTSSEQQAVIFRSYIKF
jgi:hypothetical protein